MLPTDGLNLFLFQFGKGAKKIKTRFYLYSDMSGGLFNK